VVGVSDRASRGFRAVSPCVRAALAISLPNQKPRPHYTLAFHRDLAAFLEHKMVFQPAMDYFWHLDLAFDAGGLHS
jgi:hypothetical protein